MSRIGKRPIILPDSVEIEINGTTIVVKGPKGELSRDIRPEILLQVEDGKINFKPVVNNQRNRAFWGLTRTLVDNMVKGVTEGYVTKLQIEGVGYKAVPEGEGLVLRVGFSHPVNIDSQDGIKFLVERNIVSVSGIDKELVTQTAARIRKIKPPEPYKGKGIRYVGEIVRRKVGKKAVGK
ncbi:MAG: 50S ribosomal protein L6 [Candidatus Pacebacteria bacterium]|nr:50S ribosomal protein L6 [Candidatus Paceibacterota bacterium]